jgi:hypothetical protein
MFLRCFALQELLTSAEQTSAFQSEDRHFLVVRGLSPTLLVAHQFTTVGPCLHNIESENFSRHRCQRCSGKRLLTNNSSCEQRVSSVKNLRAYGQEQRQTTVFSSLKHHRKRSAKSFSFTTSVQQKSPYRQSNTILRRLNSVLLAKNWSQSVKTC